MPVIVIDRDRLWTTLDDFPALRAFDARAKQAGAGVGLARADKHADWSLQTVYWDRDRRFGDLLPAGFSVQLPLFARTRQNPMMAARMIDVDRVPPRTRGGAA